MKRLSTVVLLLVFFSAHADPCPDEKDEKRVTGVSECLLTRHYGPESAPHLLIWLHGDGSAGGPANYHFPIAGKAVTALAAQSVQAVALVRPGYPDGEGGVSTVAPDHGGRSDHYTRRNIDEVAGAIRRLKERHQARDVTVIGHSGGAATTAIILGTHPGLIDNAVLVACPCDLVPWRAGRRAWNRSENPQAWVEHVATTTRVLALTGSRDDNTSPELARHYVESLAARGVNARYVEIANATHNSAFRATEVTEAISSLLAAP